MTVRATGDLRGDVAPMSDRRLYGRILRYLRPYKGIFFTAIVAMVVFGAMDAFSFTLLIPFMNALFAGASTTSAAGGLIGAKHDLLHDLLRATLGSLIPAGDPMGALRNVVLVMNFSNDVFQRVTRLNMDIHGVEGCMTNARVEKLVRDAHIWTHLAGDTVQRVKVVKRWK